MTPFTPDGLLNLLDRHVLEPWFPRCLDQEHGGFLCDFDVRWRPDGPQDKLLEFQARQTRTAALACRLHPEDPAWEEACRRGLEVLRHALWDDEYGGWFVIADRAWRPLDPGAKHLHGMAYAVQACLEVADSIDAPEAAELAQEALAWIEEHAWDAEHGLYWGWLARDGSPLALDAGRTHGERDHIGAPWGAKDINTNGDMLELLTEVRRRGGSARSGERLARLVSQFDRWTAEAGHLPLHFSRALEPLRGPATGYEVQASWRLPLARASLGEPVAYGDTERTLLGGALATRGPTGGILSHSGLEEWWVQFELLRSLTLNAALDPADAPVLLAEARDHLAYLDRRFVDERHGGVRLLARRPLRPSIKGSRWKDASHECAGLAAGALHLGQAGDPAPTEGQLWP